MSDPNVAAAAAHARAVFAELRQEVAVARAEVDAASRQPLLTKEEREQVQEVARDGAMGREMQDFAREVDRGGADWEDFLRGRDGRRDLLESFTRRAVEDVSDEALRAAAEARPDDADDSDD